MYGDDKILVITVLLIVALFISFIGIIVVTKHQETVFYDCYYVEAPFGILWVDIEGNFFLGFGSIDSALRESYIVKYYDGGYLKSLTLEAEATSIVVDGTFRLAETRVKNALFECDNRRTYIIHLPYLPDLISFNERAK